MADIMLLSVVVLAIHITTAESADGESCPLEDLDVRTNSTYVIYGVTSDETVFLFSSDDIAKSGRTPRDQLASYLNQTGKTGANRMFPAGGRLEVLYFVQKNYMPWEFHLVIRVRDRFENETDNHGVPRRTRFLRKYNNASFGDVFSVADTDHIRFHLKYTDEHGLHGGIVTWPFIYLFEIERKKHYLRFKTIERPNGYRYTDESRLWNEGDDLAQNSELERLGKEWQYAFRTIKGRSACIASKGIPNMDIHLLWRHNMRLRDVFRKTKLSVYLHESTSDVMSINGSLLDGALVVGILHGILFMCETKGFEALDQIYNFAVTYVEINPNFGKSQQSDEVKVFLLSQHFKEFFVVVANIAGLYYKAFKTLTDRCRAYTLDLRDFETIPKLTLYSEKNILTTIDVFENVLYLYYGVKSATYTVPLGGTNAMQPEMLEVPLPPMNTDTFSGKRFFHFGTQVQVFNEKSLLLDMDSVWYGRIRTVQRFSRSKFDALLVLKRTEQVTAPSMGFYFGIKDCLLFVVRFLTQLDSLPQSKGGGCTKRKDVRIFLQRSHLIVLSRVRKRQNSRLHYLVKKVEFESAESKWMEDVHPSEFESANRAEYLGENPSTDMCYVSDLKLHCVLRITDIKNEACDVTMSVTNLRTNIRERVYSLPIYKLYGGSLHFPDIRNDDETTNGNLCKMKLDFIYMKDGEDVIIRPTKTGRYLSQNEDLYDGDTKMLIPCFSYPFASRLVSWTRNMATWLNAKDTVGYICNADKTSFNDFDTNRTQRQLERSFYGYVGVSFEYIDERNLGAEKHSIYNNAPDYIDEPVPPQAEEIRMPRGDGVPKQQQLWDVHCLAWQKTAALITCAILLGELILFAAVFVSVQCVAKPRIRRYRIQKGIAISRKKRAMKKRALRRLRRLRWRRLRRKRRTSQTTGNSERSNTSSSTERSSSKKSSDVGVDRSLLTAPDSDIVLSEAAKHAAISKQHEHEEAT